MLLHTWIVQVRLVFLKFLTVTQQQELKTLIAYFGKKMSKQIVENAKCAHNVGQCLFAARKQFIKFGSVKLVLPEDAGSEKLYDWTQYLCSLKGCWFSEKTSDTNLAGEALDIMFFSQLRLVVFFFF